MLRTLAQRTFAQRDSLIKMLPSMVYQTRTLQFKPTKSKYFNFEAEDTINDGDGTIDEAYKICKTMATNTTIMTSDPTDKILLGKCLIQSQSDKPNYQITANFHNDVITMNFSEIPHDCPIDLNSLLKYPLNKHFDIKGRHEIVHDDKGLCDKLYVMVKFMNTVEKDHTNPLVIGTVFIKSKSNTPNYQATIQTGKEGAFISIIFEKIQCNKIPT